MLSLWCPVPRTKFGGPAGTTCRGHMAASSRTSSARTCACCSSGSTPRSTPVGRGGTSPGRGNRLWRTLHEAGFTDRVLHPAETDAIVAAGLGITNVVPRATARADELTDEEIRAGVAPLRRLVRRLRRRGWGPAYVAFLGVSTYRVAFGQPRAKVGPQSVPFEGTGVWVLPNPSGLNAHYQQPTLTAAYAELRAAAFPDG